MLLRCGLLLVLLVGVPIRAGEMAITLDDMPLAYGRYFKDSEKVRIFNQLLAVLEAHNVKVYGFVIGGNMEPGFEPLMKKFLAQGHQVGNHTHDHPDLNAITMRAYEQNILEGQRVIKHWVRGPKYFRYPMLHQGDTPEKRNGINRFLKQNGFEIAHVTIDNDEWRYNRDYVDALRKKDPDLAKKIAEEYLKHMAERTHYFSKLAHHKLGRDVKHILLLHWNYINAKQLDRLLTYYTKKGWTFISLPEALSDPVYQMKDHYVGPRGLSWLQRIKAVKK